jgi:hypothetical protein
MRSLLLFVLALLAATAGAAPPARKCSTRCLARECKTFSITYGKYCGITHTGCPGEEPCDAYDACCQAHDGCVKSGGLSAEDVTCHAAFKQCLADALASGAAPFTKSAECSAETVVETMSNGMDLASRFSAMFGGNVKVEL